MALAGDLMTGVIDAAMQLELKANYTRAAHTNGQTLTATGTVIDSGRRTATAEARVLDEHGKLPHAAIA